MKYLSGTQAAEKRSVSQERAVKLCERQRVKGDQRKLGDTGYIRREGSARGKRIILK